jgi:L-Ala-D/L-Glu epimerase
MKIKSCTIFALRIPFVETFAHHTKRRRFSDSIIVRVRTSDGATGYGEGLARDYVTGETVESSVRHIREVLWPAVAEHEYAELEPRPDPLQALAQVDESLPFMSGGGVIAFNAARAAVEIALVDALLRSQNISLSKILKPRRAHVTYSGVISSGSLETAARRARQLRLFGLRDVKVKISERRDVERLRAVREVMGEGARLRVDANGAFNAKAAIDIASELSPLRIEVFEQPTARREDLSELREVKNGSAIPVMADESLVTIDDARRLVDEKACDYFNLRVSKCGGLAPCLRLARLAEEAGLRFQLGSQVGETAVLSAAGRHLAAHLSEPAFIEGSYGKLLLAEDVSREPFHFGHGGRASIPRAAGLGIRVRVEILEKHAHARIHLGDDEKSHA